MLNSTSFAQLEKPVTWSYHAKRINKTEAIIYLKAKISGNWHIYSQDVKQEAMRLKFNYKSSKNYQLVGKTIAPKPIRIFDKVLKMELSFFEKEVVFKQKIKSLKSTEIVSATVEFMACNDNQCLPADEIMFNISIK